MRRRGWRRIALALVGVGVVLLVGLNVASSVLVIRHFNADALNTSRLYSGVFAGLNSSRPGGEAEALLRLGERVRALGMPLVVTDSLGRVTAAANLPFEAPLEDARVREFIARLDRVNPPVVDAEFGTLHYGPMPVQRLLTVLGVLQALALLGTIGVAVFAFRSALDSQRDRVFVGMAREAAHQLGTPLSSLNGWIEQLRSRPTPPTGLAEHLSADAERLERVARRFERIGNPARRERIQLGALAERVARYFRPRLPRRVNPITLRVEAQGVGPLVVGDPVLLEWALEALVKNAIDALQGRRGTIRLQVAAEGGDAVVRVIDDGPGVPREMRRAIFEPGTTTKERGWGIGLALARRVMEELHRGALVLEPTTEGSSFAMRMPLSKESR